MKNENGLDRSANRPSSLKSIWQDIGRSRRGTGIVFSATAALLLWIAPSTQAYDLLYTLLIVVTTVFPLVYPVSALYQSD